MRFSRTRPFIRCTPRRWSSPLCVGRSDRAAGLSPKMGGHNNTAAIIVALSAVLGRRGLDAHRLSPWYFPSADAYRKKLEGAGFTVEEIAIVPRPTILPTGVEAWLNTFAEDFLGAVPEPDRLHARSEVADLLRPVLMDETGTWIADYVRLRFRATRPG